MNVGERFFFFFNALIPSNRTLSLERILLNTSAQLCLTVLVE